MFQDRLSPNIYSEGATSPLRRKAQEKSGQSSEHSVWDHVFCLGRKGPPAPPFYIQALTYSWQSTLWEAVSLRSYSFLLPPSLVTRKLSFEHLPWVNSLLVTVLHHYHHHLVISINNKCPHRKKVDAQTDEI